ncbi:YezD family protein [Thermoactinomyces sp. CICC 10521]|jgi:hypothetical protein|uniref:YezD family protein n=1 Tax=Thermoactinomyces daqus TaxID=1329516 RepID=A0A7W2AHS6_9BACL|nr:MULTISPECIES: YezD family protein [Thermoactinomyces]MBA4543522.1 YezD family protein [Thermoactinomyces daqus]MBH8599143.1 YezD family protein [Thermoactinomyces sp. CICC 10523]MBH8605640.1 YezD family protein [Thermoactinomyces sp. CICC 10522]MBH8609151.1 YezD family protein [Thermoactinomyces sp. CICC 10521]
MEGIFLSDHPYGIDEQWIERIIRALEGLKYGSVLITVHDSRIVQIDRTEKIRG